MEPSTWVTPKHTKAHQSSQVVKVKRILAPWFPATRYGYARLITLTLTLNTQSNVITIPPALLRLSTAISTQPMTRVPLRPHILAQIIPSTPLAAVLYKKKVWS